MQLKKPVDYMQKGKKAKITIVISIIIAIVLLAGTIAIISHKRKIQAEIKEHMSNAVLHTKEGIANAIPTVEMFAHFFSMLTMAEETIEKAAENTDFNGGLLLYEKANLIYEEADIIAKALSFKEGIAIAETGIKGVHESIVIAKRNEGLRLLEMGSLSEANMQDYDFDMLSESLEYYHAALGIFTEIGDLENAEMTQARINDIEARIAQNNTTHEDNQGTTPPDAIEENEILSNYNHNTRINFDLRTPIDFQRQRPASEILMGTHEGYNEGWYNGCGWIATYNALLLLENPIHPAEIVKHFEESVGIVLGGIFGTYPNAIEDYLRSFGYTVNQTIFPQLRLNIDESVKSSKVSILAYTHTSAAHYVTIEYKEDIDKFVIYNDGFARAYSENLGFQSLTTVGAAVDSIEAFISNTPNILFSFSLITIN